MVDPSTDFHLKHIVQLGNEIHSSHGEDIESGSAKTRHQPVAAAIAKPLM